jgi:hypothetical protein
MFYQGRIALSSEFSAVRHPLKDKQLLSSRRKFLLLWNPEVGRVLKMPPLALVLSHVYSFHTCMPSLCKNNSDAFQPSTLDLASGLFHSDFPTIG